MTTELYTTFKKTNSFKKTPIFDDWNIKRDWNKAGSLTFSSYLSLEEGTHVKLVSSRHRTFAGQIVKKTDTKNDFYKYECLDYKRYLLREVSETFKKKTTHQIVKLLFKRYLGSSPLKLSLKKTKTVFSSLTFKDVTILEVISQLISLEFQKGTLIYFNIDENANLIYKPYPEEMKGYSIGSAISFVNNTDYSDIQTGYELYDENGKLIKKYSNKALVSVWGDIRNVTTLSDNSSSSSDSKDNTDIKKIVASVNKSMRGYKHPNSGGSCDCFCMSDKIFAKLKSNKVPCRILSYYSASASSGTHRTVSVKYKSGWKDFDYSGMDNWYSALSTKKSLKVLKEYKG